MMINFDWFLFILIPCSVCLFLRHPLTQVAVSSTLGVTYLWGHLLWNAYHAPAGELDSFIVLSVMFLLAGQLFVFYVLFVVGLTLCLLLRVRAAR